VIVDAIARADADGARDAMQSHLEIIAVVLRKGTDGRTI